MKTTNNGLAIACGALIALAGFQAACSGDDDNTGNTSGGTTSSSSSTSGTSGTTGASSSSSSSSGTSGTSGDGGTSSSSSSSSSSSGSSGGATADVGDPCPTGNECKTGLACSSQGNLPNGQHECSIPCTMTGANDPTCAGNAKLTGKCTGMGQCQLVVSH